MDNPIDIWNRIAGWWDKQVGEGNDFQKQLINPTTLALLDVKPGQRILEIACGNGNFSRILGSVGASVVAVDGSSVFLDLARQRTGSGQGKIDYRQLDVCDERQVRSLGSAEFDSAVCNMAMMDIETIDPLLRALPAVLKPGAPFVFSVCHPCFNSSDVRMTAELVNEDGKLEQRFGISVTRYLKPFVNLSSGILNQPEPHPLFHRPISVILRSCFSAGWIVDGFEEPAFSGSEGGNTFSWKKRPDLSPAMVVRIRQSPAGA